MEFDNFKKIKSAGGTALTLKKSFGQEQQQKKHPNEFCGSVPQCYQSEIFLRSCLRAAIKQKRHGRGLLIMLTINLVVAITDPTNKAEVDAKAGGRLHQPQTQQSLLPLLEYGLDHKHCGVEWYALESSGMRRSRVV